MLVELTAVYAGTQCQGIKLVITHDEIAQKTKARFSCAKAGKSSLALAAFITRPQAEASNRRELGGYLANPASVNRLRLWSSSVQAAQAAVSA
jgi:hypothetical protein